MSTTRKYTHEEVDQLQKEIDQSIDLSVSLRAQFKKMTEQLRPETPKEEAKSVIANATATELNAVCEYMDLKPEDLKKTNTDTVLDQVMKNIF